MAEFDVSRWQVLSALFDEALGLEGEARAEWLGRLSHAQPQEARDLAALLDDHAASARAGFLGRPPELPPLEGDEGTLAGRVLGAYTLEAIVGQGGMGSVWRAHRSDGRYSGNVAIKLLNVALIGRAGGARFQREGRILARLAHPHIARLIDAGVSLEGQPYLALEYIEGAAIDRFCDERRLDCEARIRLFIDVLSAVSHSHANLIVHRDVKPPNVLVDSEGNVKLLDFGIAKLLDVEATGETAALTRAEARLLTPEYAAPEQLLGQPVTTQSDIYSLGVLLYVLLCGSSPLAGRALSKADIVRAVTEHEAPRMSSTVGGDDEPARKEGEADSASSGGDDRADHRSTTRERLRRILTGDLDNIAAKAMRVDPLERYPTVAAFADDLRRFLEQRPVSARPDTFAYRLAKFTSRNRGAVAASVLTATAILAGVAGTAWQAHRANAQAARAEQLAARAQAERDRALKQLSYAEASDEFLAFLLQEGGGKSISATELLTRGEATVDRQFADDPILRIHMLILLANLFGEAQEKNRASAVLLKAQAAASGVTDPELQSQLDCTRAERFGDDNDFGEAKRLFDRGIGRMRGADIADRGVLAECLSARAQVESSRGDNRAALADAQAALAAFGRAPRPGQRMGVLTARRGVAEAQGGLGNEAIAIENLQAVLDDMNRLGRGHNTTELGVLSSLGRHLSRAGQWLRAAEIDRRELELAVDVEGADAVEPASRANYAKLLSELGQPLVAQGMFIAALQSANGRGHTRSLGPVSLTAARAWCAEGNLGRCRALLADARGALVGSLPPGHSMLGSLEFEEGRLAAQEGETSTAIGHFRRAEDIFANAPDFNPNRMRNASALARALASTDLVGARNLAQATVTRARSSLAGAAQSMFLGESLLALGEITAKQDDRATARASLEDASAQLLNTMGADAPLTIEATQALARLPP